MTTLKSTEFEDYEFTGPEGFDVLKKRIQYMANVLGEGVFITGYTSQHYKGLRLTPFSQFAPAYNVCIWWACWPRGFVYAGQYSRSREGR